MGVPILQTEGLPPDLSDRECVDRLRERGIQRCHLFVFHDNRDALAFWEKTGWIVRTDLAMMSKSTIEGG